MQVLKSEDDHVQNEESLIKHCSYLFEICGANTSNGCGAQVLVVPLTCSPISHWPEKEGEKVLQEPEQRFPTVQEDHGDAGCSLAAVEDPMSMQKVDMT